MSKAAPHLNVESVYIVRWRKFVPGMHCKLCWSHIAVRQAQDPKAMSWTEFLTRTRERAPSSAIIRKRRTSSQYRKQDMHTGSFISRIDAMDAAESKSATVLVLTSRRAAFWMGKAAKPQIKGVFRFVRRSSSPLQNCLTDDESFS